MSHGRPAKAWLLAAALALCARLPQPAAAGVPDAVVSKDGSGSYTSVQDAVSAAPMTAQPGGRPWVIHVKPGTYRERVYVQRERGDILLEGEDAATTILTYDLNAKLVGPDGKPIGTFRTPTLQVDGDGFTVAHMTVANAAGPVGQALALRVDGDRASFWDCRFLGWQDTILVNRGRHYFRGCRIEGHVDFIFGAATAFFDRCEIHCVGDGYVTAASTPKGAAHGLVFADCRITAEPGVRTYLGRPWRDYARVEFVRTEMSAAVRPEGWSDWNKPQARQTSFMAEFASSGPGGDPAGRVSWSHRLGAAEAEILKPEVVLRGEDRWDPTSSYPSKSN